MKIRRFSPNSINWANSVVYSRVFKALNHGLVTSSVEIHFIKCCFDYCQIKVLMDTTSNRWSDEHYL